MPRTSRSIITLLGAYLYIPVAILALVLLATAVVPHSRYFALALVSLSPTLFCFASDNQKTLRRGTLPFLLFVAFFTTAALLSPSGTPSKNSPFSSHTFNGSSPHPPRLSPANLVAEVDQLRLGTRLIAPLDPLVDRSQATRLRDLTTTVYTDLHSASPSLVQSGSQLGTCYQDIFTSPRFQHHFFRYIPANSSAPTPAIIFLHGSLGNFQAYIHLLKPVADQLGATLIAPTFGAGEWSRPEAPQTIHKAIDYCRSQPGIDAGNITLIGLSNGGIGVTRALTGFPEAIRSFIYLSPVIPTKDIATVPADKPVLVIHGTADRRIPLTSVQSATTHLENLGADVTTHLHQDEDHFLFFSKTDPVIDQITHWLEAR